MAAKKEDSTKSMFRTILATISDIVFPQLTKSAGELMDSVQTKALVIEAKIIQKMAAAAIIGVAFIFLAFAGLFYMIEYRGMTKALAFLIIGALILFVGMYLQIKSLLEDKAGSK